MNVTLTLQLSPEEAANASTLHTLIAREAGVASQDLTGYTLLKRSIDARRGAPKILLQVNAYLREPAQPRELTAFTFQDVHAARHKVLLIGTGPASLFAALKLLEAGIQPILFERGKDVRSRRRDLALLNKQGKVNPESNYCFGEGGAGTYSDGKLYTRSTKRGDIKRILELFYHFGAPEEILFEAHPHIGTNKLPALITRMRQQILDCGGQLYFNHKVQRILHANGQVTGIQLADGTIVDGSTVILATGHSARDIFYSLHQNKLQLSAKPFALGIRIEHPQSLIDQAQYHCSTRNPLLPPAAYSLVQQVNERGVFSFCMCPGGIIAPAATAEGEIVVNGWSPSKRNNAFANSGIVVAVEEKDFAPLIAQHGPLAALEFQQQVEQKSFHYGGGLLQAPAQRMTDFIENKFSSTLPSTSYIPGLQSAPLQEVLPPFVHEALRKALKAFGQKMKGYLTREAVVVATESRTSSPVRIPRDPVTLEHPQAAGLYPCGEGAGYAGGIVSAALDGERVAERIIRKLG